MPKKKLDLAKGIGEALESWLALPLERQKIQLQFRLAVEFSAIKHAIELGILDDNGEISDRTHRLIREAKSKYPNQ